jgi:hypothetical protein
MDTKVAQMDTKVAQVDTKVAQVHTKVAQVDTKVTQVDSKINQLNPLHSAVGQLREEISVLKVLKEPHSRIVGYLPGLFEEFRAKRFNLLWRGSRDGFTAKEFHRRCDGRANTLTLIADTDERLTNHTRDDRMKSCPRIDLKTRLRAHRRPARIRCPTAGLIPRRPHSITAHPTLVLSLRRQRPENPPVPVNRSCPVPSHPTMNQMSTSGVPALAIPRPLTAMPPST